MASAAIQMHSTIHPVPFCIAGINAEAIAPRLAEDGQGWDMRKLGETEMVVS